MDSIKNVLDKFENLIEIELERIDNINIDEKIINYKSLDKIIIGAIYGNEKEEILMDQAIRILKLMMADEIKNNKIEIRTFKKLNIEDGKISENDIYMIKKCHVLIKSKLNKIIDNQIIEELELYGLICPINIPEKNINWVFVREITEGEYIWGDKGIEVNDNLAIDFKIGTRPANERLFNFVFNYGINNNKNKLTIVTNKDKTKLVDSKFLEICEEIGKNYPEIKISEKYVDDLASKMMDNEYNKNMELIVLPNLYGDIIIDIAVNHQGGQGGMASAYIGNSHGVFEGMYKEDKQDIVMEKNSDPTNLISGVAQLMGFIGYKEKEEKLQRALYLSTVVEREFVVLSDDEKELASSFTDYLISVLEDLD